MMADVKLDEISALILMKVDVVIELCNKAIKHFDKFLQ